MAVEAIGAAKVVAIAAGVLGGGYLIYDALQAKNDPANGSKSLVQRAADTVVQNVAISDVPAVKTGMPQSQNGRFIDPPNAEYNNMTAISQLCNEILCNNASVNGGMIAAAFASCECQTGGLSNNCYNASLFNVHWRSGDPYPRVRIGSEIMPSFTTGEATLVGAYRACINAFKSFLQQRHPRDGAEALSALMGGQPDRFQIAIARMNYSPGYTATITNGVITGSHFVQARLERLLNAGLLEIPRI